MGCRGQNLIFFMRLYLCACVTLRRIGLAGMPSPEDSGERERACKHSDDTNIKRHGLTISTTIPSTTSEKPMTAITEARVQFARPSPIMASSGANTTNRSPISRITSPAILPNGSRLPLCSPAISLRPKFYINRNPGTRKKLCLESLALLLSAILGPTVMCVLPTTYNGLDVWEWKRVPHFGDESSYMGRATSSKGKHGESIVNPRNVRDSIGVKFFPSAFSSRGGFSTGTYSR